MPRPIPRLVCPEAGEFLCVNTPPGSVKENFVILKGRLYLDSSTLSALSVSVQNEYTREIGSIVLGEPLRENCWERALTSQNNFCLEAGGKFSVHAPLDELGPYTLLVTASRAEGASMQKTVRTSFVVRPTLTSDTVTYETGATHTQLHIDLLKDCEGEACDFIGTTTGGVWVTIDNAIASPQGREVRCETNVVQGGPGQFTIGVPVQPGSNQLKVIVCNAVTGFETSRCPQITLPPLQVSGGLPAIEVLSVTPLRFKIANDRSEGCDDSVKVTMNLEGPRSVCPNPQGIYEVSLRALEGYNIASIEADRSNQKIIKTITFTKGRVLSPFDESGGRLSNAIRLSLARGMIEETLWPLFGDYLKSGKFGEMLREWAEEGGSEGRGTRDENVELLYCPKTAGGGANPLRMKIIQPPRIGKIELGPLEFRAQKLKTSLKAKDVSLSIQLYKDENNDRRPDIDPLPLKIAFEEIELEPILETSGSQETLLVKLTSPHTDCDYKRRGACFSMPALFTPKKFKGGANRAGAFATCDHSQAVSPRMEEICHALNVLDRQTGGVIQEKILDTLNRVYACSASASLTAMLRNGIPIQKTSPLFALEGRVGAETLQIGEEGLGASLFTQFGNPEIFETWPQELRQAGVGILLTGVSATQTTFSEEGMGLELFMPLLSQIFWGLRSPGGEPFAIQIDEAFFRDRGFDFDSRCVGGEADPLCNIRPRAQEILGSVVTDYGVVEPNDPLTLNLTPSLAFPLRLAVVNEEGKVRLELADWELDVASPRGSLMKASLSLKLTLEVSQPTVRSEDPDHLRVEVKVVPAESRVWLTPIEESNTTVIPGTIFFSTLEETFQFAIDNFSQEGKEIVIPIDRFIEFPEESFFTKLGLKELSWGPNGLGWEWSSPANRLRLNFLPHWN